MIMEQEPIPILEFIGLFLFLGSITFLIGALFQVYILRRNKKSIWTSIIVVVLTRILTLISSFFIWAYWSIVLKDIMFMFIFLPAVLPELIFSILMLKLFGNKIIRKKSQLT